MKNGFYKRKTTGRLHRARESNNQVIVEEKEISGEWDRDRERIDQASIYSASLFQATCRLFAFS